MGQKHLEIFPLYLCGFCVNLRMCAGKTEKTVLPFWVMESSTVCIWLEGMKVSHPILPNMAQTASCKNHSAHLLTGDCTVSAAWLRVTVRCWWLPYKPGIRRQIPGVIWAVEKRRAGLQGPVAHCLWPHRLGWGFVEAQIGELLAHRGDSYSNTVLGFRHYSLLLGYSQSPIQVGYSCSGHGP